MKRLLVFIAACLLGFSALAGKLISETVAVTTGAATAGTNTTTISGYLDTIIIDIPAGSRTCDWDIVWSPPESTIGNVNLYTNDGITADTWVRPRVDATDIAAAALTGDPPVRFAIPERGLITVTVTNASATNLTWNAVFIWEKP